MVGGFGISICCSEADVLDLVVCTSVVDSSDSVVVVSMVFGRFCC